MGANKDPREKKTSIIKADLYIFVNLEKILRVHNVTIKYFYLLSIQKKKEKIYKKK